MTKEGAEQRDDSAWRWIAADEAEAFANDVVLSSARTLPIVAVTTGSRTGELTLDPGWLAREIDGRAQVVAFETGDATWALSDALPDRLDVYGGAARIWWPGVSRATDPYDHPLIFFAPAEADAIARRIAATIRDGLASMRRYEGWTGPGARPSTPAVTPPAPATAARREQQRAEPELEPPKVGGVTKTGRPVLGARITAIRGSRIDVRVGRDHGTLAFADEKLAELASRLRVGDEVPVFVATDGPAGLRFSTQGLLPGPAASRPPIQPDRSLSSPQASAEKRRPERTPERLDPWQILDEEYRVGDVVRGRVCAIRDAFVLIELLPGAALRCHISQLAPDFVHHPEDEVAVGERVNVEILSLDSHARRGEVSIRSAGWTEPLPAISPGPGQPLFLEDEEPLAQVDDGHAAQVLVELENANADRAELRKRLKAANEQAVALRKELRGAEDRVRALETRGGDADPLSSETAFLAAVRVEYARRVSESDRADYPLMRMRIGREFLDRVRALEGVAIDKVVEVCAQVASGRAHLVAAREVHELRGGEGGSPARERERDGAKAWRCALQINTASARRLHWWEIPGKHPRLADGRIIEFASVAVHDDFSIP